MREFDFLEPTSVDEASRMLADLGDEARVIAGGTALMLGMRQRMLAPTHLVSMANIARLRGIDRDDQGGLRIGALTRHADVARSQLIQQTVPVLAYMAARVANPQVRNQGTLGGNLCYADPSTDPPGCLMALGAQVVLGGARGERVLSMEEFLVDYYVTALEPDEILLEIRVPAMASDAVGRYSRYLRTAAEHRPLVNVALVARRDGAVGGRRRYPDSVAAAPGGSAVARADRDARARRSGCRRCRAGHRPRDRFARKCRVSARDGAGCGATHCRRTVRAEIGRKLGYLITRIRRLARRGRVF